MKQTDKQFFSKLSKHREPIEKDREDIEREETDGELVTDVLNDFNESYAEGCRTCGTTASAIARKTRMNKLSMSFCDMSWVGD